MEKLPFKNRNHLVSLIKAGLSATGPVGGMIASLIGDSISSHTQRSIEKALAELDEQLATLDERIDIENINRDEFAELFKSTYLVIVRSHQEEKIKAAVALLTNIMLNKGDEDKLGYTQLDHFCRCLDTLSIGAIQALGKIFEICTTHVTGGILGRTFNHNFHQLQVRSPEIEPWLLMGFVAELNGLNLVHIPGAPSIRTEDYSNYNIELTQLGISFVLYLLKWPESPNSYSPPE